MARITRPRSSRAVLGIVLPLALFSLAEPAAAETPVSAAVQRQQTTGGEYVAMGDSYASGAGMPLVNDAYCDRTGYSYPTFAKAFTGGAAFKDVTCSGATTRQVWNYQGSKPPQADAVTPATKVVTLTLGGNDVGFTSILTTCVLVASSNPAGSPCKDHYNAGGTDVVSERINIMEGRIRDVVTDVKRRAPGARVLVVGYPSILPDSGAGCAEVPFAKGDFVWLRDMAKKLNRALERRGAGGGAGVSYVDTYTSTIGHDMCAPREARWIESLTPAPNTMAAHPNLTGQLAMGLAVAAELEK